MKLQRHWRHFCSPRNGSTEKSDLAGVAIRDQQRKRINQSGTRPRFIPLPIAFSCCGGMILWLARNFLVTVSTIGF